MTQAEPVNRALVAGVELTLFPEKAIYWETENTLLIADLHIGKAAHFRKSGIPIPMAADERNFDHLDLLISKTKCLKIIFLGDLFHSSHNTSCDEFIVWRQKHLEIAMFLIVGNHDILGSAFYASARLQLLPSLVLGPYVFTHKPLDHPHPKFYNLAGHVHPGVRLVGRGRQSLRLACFYFGHRQGLMPSFGDFTGNYVISPQQGDQIYVISDSIIRKVL